jgi:plastocyanin
MQSRRICLVVAALFGLSPLSAQAADIRITIDKLVYTPAEVRAKVGDTVEWINKDVIAHTATAKNKGWDVLIGPDKTVRMVLKKSGEFDYYCRFHPNMQGHLTVVN